MLLAAQSMAVGTVLVRYVTKYADPIMATGYHMLLGGIPLLLLSYQQEAATLAERLPQLTGGNPFEFWTKRTSSLLLGSAGTIEGFSSDAKEHISNSSKLQIIL